LPARSPCWLQPGLSPLLRLRRDTATQASWDSKGPLGISGTLTALSAPVVQAGHVAAWVGVGGPNEAPDGNAEWLQVGMNSARGSTNNHLYYEYVRPGIPVTYVQLAANIPVGQSVRVAVLKTATGRDLWRVWVGGKPVSDPILLPGSEGRLTPVATSLLLVEVPSDRVGSASRITQNPRYVEKIGPDRL
jgi:hypothetical protein